MQNVINFKNHQFKDKMISAKDIRALFNNGVSQATLANWVKKGFINRYKIGGLVFYKESEIKSLIERAKE